MNTPLSEQSNDSNRVGCPCYGEKNEWCPCDGSNDTRIHRQIFGHCNICGGQLDTVTFDSDIPKIVEILKESDHSTPTSTDTKIDTKSQNIYGTDFEVDEPSWKAGYEAAMKDAREVHETLLTSEKNKARVEGYKKGHIDASIEAHNNSLRKFENENYQ